MNCFIPTSYNRPFSHIYIEEEALSYPAAQKILHFFSNRELTPILVQRYQDIFHRPHQVFSIQKNSPSLILAVKHGSFLYPGAPVCQDFGNSYFYYTSFVMNCLFDCEYCFLQGMYPSAHMVIFVNIEDYFCEIKKMLIQHPVYLCISYDTDLLALEPLTGFLKQYIAFAADYPYLTTELRTKSAGNISFADEISPAVKSRFILAYTLSPSPIIQQYEHGTASLESRLDSIRLAAEMGFPIRLCFDPLLRVPGFENIYQPFFYEVKNALADIPVFDASIGVFRISDAYLKQMRKQRPCSAILQYPFENENHVCSYGIRSKEMVEFAKKQLVGWISEECIYIA